MLLTDKMAGETPLNGLDQIYADILRDSIFEDGVLDEEKGILAELFKRVVGPVAVVFEPLSIQALSSLSSTPIQDIKETLTCVYSVLAFPRDEGGPVQLLHLHFANSFWTGRDVRTSISTLTRPPRMRCYSTTVCVSCQHSSGEIYVKGAINIFR
jgi:hypothetical protein